jgi:hypothetical protein
LPPEEVALRGESIPTIFSATQFSPVYVS